MCCNSSQMACKMQDSSAAPSHAAARNLASLLKTTPEFQNFLEISQKISADPQSSALFRQLRNMQSMFLPGEEDPQMIELQRNLEALPMMQEYRAAEKQVNELFTAVDQLISQETGIAFAENAKASGFG